MNKERYKQIVDEVYGNYINKLIFNEKDCHIDDLINQPNKTFIPYNQEEFIDKCKTHNEFSERWGLKIEERELSLEERVDYFNSKMIKEGIRTQIGTVDVDESYWRKALEETNHNIPTREITVTYKDEKLEIYE